MIRIIDSDEEDLPNYISSDKEETGEVEVSIGNEGEGTPPLSSDDEDSLDIDMELLMELMGDSDWSDSEDSYESMSDDEEDSDGDDDEDIRLRSTLIQQLPPVSVRSPVAGPAAVPQQLTVRAPQELQQQRVGPPQEGPPSVSQRWEESAFSTSGLGSSTNRRHWMSPFEFNMG